MAHRVRAASLRGFAGLVGQLGGDPAELLARQGLPESMVDEEALLPVGAVSRLLEDTARSLRCADFGLRLAQAQDLGILGPVAIAIQNAPTIGEALEAASQYLFVHQQGLAITRLHGDDGQTELCYDFGGGPLPRAMQSYDLMMGGAHRSLELLGGTRYHLTAVLLPYGPVAPMNAYTRFFGAPVLFHQQRAALVVPREFLKSATPQSSELMRAMATDYLATRFGALRRSLLPLVRMAVVRSLRSGATRLEDVAAAAALHPRTLQRHLADEGVVFETLREEIMQESALRLLRDPDIALKDVAFQLGFSQQSVLTRTCRRWFGETPSQIMSSLAREEGRG